MYNVSTIFTSLHPHQCACMHLCLHTYMRSPHTCTPNRKNTSEYHRSFAGLLYFTNRVHKPCMYVDTHAQILMHFVVFSQGPLFLTKPCIYIHTHAVGTGADVKAQILMHIIVVPQGPLYFTNRVCT